MRISDWSSDVCSSDLIKVRGIFDAGQGKRDWAATRMIADGGGEAWLASRKNGLGKLPHHLKVIDGALLVRASFNHTDPPNRLDDPKTLVPGDLDAQAPMAQETQRRLCTHPHARSTRQIRTQGS